MKLTEKTKKIAREMREKRTKELYGSIHTGSHIYFENPKNNLVDIVWKIVMEFCEMFVYEGTVLAKLKNEKDQKYYVMIGDYNLQKAVIAVLSYDQTYHAFVKSKKFVLNPENHELVDELLAKANGSMRWKDRNCECEIDKDGSIKINTVD